MKKVNELRIPAYAIVDAEQGGVLQIVTDRPTARYALKLLKERYGRGNELKIVKLAASKYIR